MTFLCINPLLFTLLLVHSKAVPKNRLRMCVIKRKISLLNYKTATAWHSKAVTYNHLRMCIVKNKFFSSDKGRYLCATHLPGYIHNSVCSKIPIINCCAIFILSMFLFVLSVLIHSLYNENLNDFINVANYMS